MFPKDEASLIAAARSGNTAALEALLERHQGRVYRFGMKMCRHPQDAEDVLQETLLAAAKSIGDFRGDSSLSSWLFTIARSFCIKKRRRSKFAPEHEESLSAEIPDAGRAPDEAAFDGEVHAALEHAIDRLEPDQREVLLLRDVEGLKAKEVSEVLGITVAAVKSRLHRARGRVREVAAPLLGMAEPAGKPTEGCKDVLTMYSKHVEGEISADLCAEMEKHLATCDRCRTNCESLRDTMAMCSRLPVSHVPDSVQDSVRTALQDFLASS